MDINRRRTVLISCFVILACYFVALYVIPFESVGWHFKHVKDTVTFSSNVSSLLEVSSERFMYTRVLEHVGNDNNKSNTTLDFVSREMDKLNTNKFLICPRPTGRLGNQMRLALRMR